MPGKRRALNKEDEADALIDKGEKLKAEVRAEVEHPFRVLKRQSGVSGLLTTFLASRAQM